MYLCVANGYCEQTVVVLFVAPMINFMKIMRVDLGFIYENTL